MLSPLREVARHLCEPAQLATRIAQWRDNAVCPERRAIFADAPAFVFEPTFCCGTSQLVLRPAAPLHLLGVEPREMLTSDFFGAIAKERGGPSIPACDVTVSVKQKDRVVANARYEQTKCLCVLQHGCQGGAGSALMLGKLTWGCLSVASDWTYARGAFLRRLDLRGGATRVTQNRHDLSIAAKATVPPAISAIHGLRSRWTRVANKAQRNNNASSTRA